MWRKATPYLIMVSLGLNLAFVAVWVAHAWSASVSQEPERKPAIWCPLHRELQVNPAQWAQIEPRLREFQETVGQRCQQVDVARSEVIEMVAAEEPDLADIREKQDEILAVKRTIQDRVVEHLLVEKEILTADQRAKLFQMLRQRIGPSSGPPMSGGGAGRGRGQVPRQQTEQ